MSEETWKDGISRGAFHNRGANRWRRGVGSKNLGVKGKPHKGIRRTRMNKRRHGVVVERDQSTIRTEPTA